MPPHVHPDHNDHNEDQHSHHEQLAEQKVVAQEQYDTQPKSEQPRPKKTARGQHPEDKSPHYKPQQEHSSEKHRGDEQADERGEAQTHHEAESRSHTCDEAQDHPSDPCMTDTW
jgi:hypothetical protein